MLKNITIFLILLISHSSFSTSEYIDIDENCDEIENCSVIPHCIREYSELDFYVTNNTKLMTTLTETFFITGKGPSLFVRLNYNFKSFAQNNSTNDTIFGDLNCTSHQTTYIWSESVLYLLGPRPLYLLSLFAVDVSEASVTIELPCLCEDVQFELLGRLTYLVSRYIARNCNQVVAIHT